MDPAQLPFIHELALFLACAGIVVPLFRRLRVSPVLGFLAIGVVTGPLGLGRVVAPNSIVDALVIRDVETTRVVAEFGVVFLLFLIGIELSPGRLWAMRRLVFGLRRHPGRCDRHDPRAGRERARCRSVRVGRARRVSGAVVDGDRHAASGGAGPDRLTGRPQQLRGVVAPGPCRRADPVPRHPACHRRLDSDAGRRVAGDHQGDRRSRRDRARRTLRPAAAVPPGERHA